METVIVKDIVIVGAGIAGLTTSLGLHRYSFSLHLYIWWSAEGRSPMAQG